jgi:hypothetical protein
VGAGGVPLGEHLAGQAPSVELGPVDRACRGHAHQRAVRAGQDGTQMHRGLRAVLDLGQRPDGRRAAGFEGGQE